MRGGVGGVLDSQLRWLLKCLCLCLGCCSVTDPPEAAKQALFAFISNFITLRLLSYEL